MNDDARNANIDIFCCFYFEMLPLEDTPITTIG